MTIEEAREYWCRRLERAENYSDEHWDAEERHAHKDYVDAMAHAITALAICREHEEEQKPKSNADRIRQMTDEELAEWLDLHGECNQCAYHPAQCKTECYEGHLKWLRKEADEDAAD